MPVIVELFAYVTLDIMGPMLKTTGGHQFILVLIDYVTQYPEAILLRSVVGLRVVEELLK